MRSDARAAAAIAILDRVLAGAPAEATLTGWARGARYAGSGDRLAVRDLVFEALRRRRSAAARGGAETGRGLILGLLREAGADPDETFTGLTHAPAALSPAERGAGHAPAPGAEALDLPDWLWARFGTDLGAQAEEAAAALRDRAPVFLRVNLARGDVAGAVAALTADGIATRPHASVRTALEVLDGARKIHLSEAYRTGLVELQDASSQAAVLALPLAPDLRILDFCAGGGGKALAMASLTGGPIVAHDAAPARMADIPARAARAGATIRICPPGSIPDGGFDLVLADAPCSGSGSWRRAPEAKWRLTPEALAAYAGSQDEVLAAAADHVGAGGILAYATCSVLEIENGERVGHFLAGGGWRLLSERCFLPGPAGDGFYLAVIQRS